VWHTTPMVAARLRGPRCDLWRLLAPPAKGLCQAVRCRHDVGPPRWPSGLRQRTSNPFHAGSNPARGAGNRLFLLGVVTRPTATRLRPRRWRPPSRSGRLASRLCMFARIPHLRARSVRPTTSLVSVGGWFFALRSVAGGPSGPRIARLSAKTPGDQAQSFPALHVCLAGSRRHFRVDGGGITIGSV